MTPQVPFRIFIGFDAREIRAWNVAAASLRNQAREEVDICRLSMHSVPSAWYSRPTRLLEHGGYWDDISDAPMSTAHAIARFLVPALCQYRGWALFTDGDVIFRRDVAKLFALADPRYAVQVVQHDYRPAETVKMDGQAQTQYARKNWSSVILFNCGHPANVALTVDLVNRVPGRDLHRFCWLTDDLVGALPLEWNWLEGHSAPTMEPAIVHHTRGVPDMPGYEHIAYADEWYALARQCGYRLQRPPAPREGAA